MPFILKISSFLLGSTILFWCIKNRTNYLKRSEALVILTSFLLLLLSIPDFQLPAIVSIKFIVIISFIILIFMLSLYLIYYEKLKFDQKFENEVSFLINHFINQHKNLLLTVKDYILVIIPAYNEESNLKKILKSAPQEIHGLPLILLVINDGSVDNTSQIASEYSLVLSLPENKGGGYALLVGFLIAKKLNAPYIVTMDADGQHKFSDMYNLITPILKKQAEIVLGSRFKANSAYSNKFRSIGIFFFNLILRILLGRKIDDCSNSYRVLTINALKQLDLKEKKHHTAEFIIRAVKKEIAILEVSVYIENRLFGKSKKGNSILYALRFARTIITSWWRF